MQNSKYNALPFVRKQAYVYSRTWRCVHNLGRNVSQCAAYPLFHSSFWMPSEVQNWKANAHISHMLLQIMLRMQNWVPPITFGRQEEKPSSLLVITSKSADGNWEVTDKVIQQCRVHSWLPRGRSRSSSLSELCSSYLQMIYKDPALSASASQDNLLPYWALAVVDT